MKTQRARYFGMCFGVRDAIQLAKDQARTRPITVLGELVHNTSVLADLGNSGVGFESDLERIHTPTVMITAHGTSHSNLESIKARGFEVVEATCPLVHHAHRQLAQLVIAGCHPVVIGQRDHVEVRGLTDDYQECDVVLTESEILNLTFHPKFGVVAQTTQPISKVRFLVEFLRRQFPKSEIHFRDTVCQPTKQRQEAAEILARDVDVVVVIGGAQSNNTRELVATCRQFCSRVHHIQTVADLNRNWFQENDFVGITAGTSTPDWILDSVEQALSSLWPPSKPSKVPSQRELETDPVASNSPIFA